MILIVTNVLVEYNISGYNDSLDTVTKIIIFVQK